MKKTLSILLAAVLIAAMLPLSAFAAGTCKFETEYLKNGKLQKPGQPHISFYYTYDWSDTDIQYDQMTIWMWPADDLLKLSKFFQTAEWPYSDLGLDSFDVGVQVDFRINDGPWQYNADWDKPGYKNPSSDNFNFIVDCGYYAVEKIQYMSLNSGQLPGFMKGKVSEVTDEGGKYMGYYLQGFSADPDLTFTYRYRYYVDYTPEDGSEKRAFSEWSDTGSFSKTGQNDHEVSDPTSLGAPVISLGEAVEEYTYDPDTYEITGSAGYANPRVYVEYPMSVYEAYLKSRTYLSAFYMGGESYECEYIFQYRKAGGDWVDETPDSYIRESYHLSEAKIYPGETVELRLKVRAGLYVYDYDPVSESFKYIPGDVIESPVSNVIKITYGGEEPGPEYTYNCSSWAVEELAEAASKGLIPDCLKDADLTKTITRAEFAAVTVKVFEALTSTKAEAAAANPFKDTSDTEVLKAYNVGITDGKNSKGDMFGPNDYLTREQAATMLSRVWKKVNYSGWTLKTDDQFNDQFKAAYTMPAKFSDDDRISPWAYDSVYFMAANHIVEGSNGKFNPKALSTASDAIGYAKREQAIVIALRMVNNL
jgi:hypothetical protein